MAELPIILGEQPVVVVPQMDLISLGRGSSGRCDRKKAGVGVAEGREVSDGGKELLVQYLRLDAVNFRPQEIPSKFHIVGAEDLVGIGRQGSVLLLQIRRRQGIAERNPYPP